MLLHCILPALSLFDDRYAHPKTEVNHWTENILYVPLRGWGRNAASYFLLGLISVNLELAEKAGPLPGVGQLSEAESGWKWAFSVSSKCQQSACTELLPRRCDSLCQLEPMGLLASGPHSVGTTLSVTHWHPFELSFLRAIALKYMACWEECTHCTAYCWLTEELWSSWDIQARKGRDPHSLELM